MDNDTAGNVRTTLERAGEVARETAERIFSAARPGAVFGEPVRAGEYTLITASEVTAAGGFGFGGMPETGTTGAAGQAGPAPPRPAGGGGGGGGASLARPVATIIIGPEGVKVQPIVDLTKIALAALTAWGAIAIMLVRMSRAARS